MSHAIINGAIVPESEAKVLISDLSIQRGYGIFDYFRARAGQPVFLEDHLDRFYHSASVMRLTPEVDRERLKRLLKELIEINGTPHAGVRITLTGAIQRMVTRLPLPISLSRWRPITTIPPVSTKASSWYRTTISASCPKSRPSITCRRSTCNLLSASTRQTMCCITRTAPSASAPRQLLGRY